MARRDLEPANEMRVDVDLAGRSLGGQSETAHGAGPRAKRARRLRNRRRRRAGGEHVPHVEQILQARGFAADRVEIEKGRGREGALAVHDSPAVPVDRLRVDVVGAAQAQRLRRTGDRLDPLPLARRAEIAIARDVRHGIGAGEEVGQQNDERGGAKGDGARAARPREHERRPGEVKHEQHVLAREVLVVVGVRAALCPEEDQHERDDAGGGADGCSAGPRPARTRAAARR